MQFEPAYCFDGDVRFNPYETFMAYPPTYTSFSYASSTNNYLIPTFQHVIGPRASYPFTVDCMQNVSTPATHTTAQICGNDNQSIPDPATYSHDAYRVDPTPLAAMGKSFFGLAPTEFDQMPYLEDLPGTPMKREPLDFNSGMAQNVSLGYSTPSHSFVAYTIFDARATPFMGASIQTLLDSEAANTLSLWPCANDGPILFSPDTQPLNEPDASGVSRCFISRYHSEDPPLPKQIRDNTNNLQRIQICSSKKRSVKPEPASVNVILVYECDGCGKKFRGIKHLKRHKKFSQVRGLNLFRCEFCGKDQFTRPDSLSTHRKLHAQSNRGNRGVKFIPAAVPIIEQEERSRKRRAPRKPRLQVPPETTPARVRRVTGAALGRVS